MKTKLERQKGNILIQTLAGLVIAGIIGFALVASISDATQQGKIENARIFFTNGLYSKVIFYYKTNGSFKNATVDKLVGANSVHKKTVWGDTWSTRITSNDQKLEITYPLTKSTNKNDIGAALKAILEKTTAIDKVDYTDPNLIVTYGF